MVRPHQIRAHIRGRRDKPWRGHGKSFMHYYMTVTDGEKVIHADDCRSLPVLHDAATRSVDSFRHLAALGYKFRSWADLVDEARF